ncbi:PREDICTED: zinc finger MYM-type protein 1-like [Amphimedon queenslandica]|uniref:DUF4371 domain-containing protein n=1 Tax=Amphimedon queenslandica TaxID=400682 RepID=A0A1X7SN99_AMPQE|nr:PREDICTED: zinc finger MYM-type protein 1-like [Amphimedon queenslandica]|eukprot:XP_011409130.1 PREDICTED: zinc finger MYM-type protein 1-like [Amphimedon queenslandica]
MATENPTVTQWLMKKTMKHTSHQIEDKMLNLIAQEILQSIAQDWSNSSFVSIMADETTDISNHEQLVIVIRWIAKDFIVHEEFIGLYELSVTDSATMVKVILGVLTRLNLSVSKVSGQCYARASLMSEIKPGVTKRILELESRAIYIQCYGHALNLAAGDTIKRSKVMLNALDTTRDITKLVESSPKCEAIFQEFSKA